MSKFAFIRRLSKKQKVLAVVLLLVIAVGAAYALGVFDKDTKQTSEQPDEPIYSQLMGIEVEADVAKRPLLGVMIENHPDARPQTGLSSASIVFEAVAEGGITRYLALFQENMPTELGSVRSVRTYYLDWAMGFDASIAHAGGSADALALLDSRDAKTLSQFKYPEPYHRVDNREAPHDLFAKTDALRDLQEKLGHKTAKFDEIPRSSDSPAQAPTAETISIDYSYDDFAVEFRYDKATNSYVRYLTGSPDIDAATNKPITVKNLVVIKMPTDETNAIGSGDASLFKDGNVQSIRWKQTSFRDRIVLTDTQGKEVPLNRGSTWFAVLPATGSVSH